MGLGFHYAYQAGPNTIVEAYSALVGDPAMGPVAYPHRASAMELPQASISHHLQDSTHIADKVVDYRNRRDRFLVGARLALPTKNWAAQVSTGRIAHPEQLEPGDQSRTTASMHYSRPMAGGSWSSSFVLGRGHAAQFEFAGPAGTYRIAASTAGFTRDIDWFRRVETGIGANFTAYKLPGAIQPIYSRQADCQSAAG